jgi:tyrosyl-tRNA synthetase
MLTIDQQLTALSRRCERILSAEELRRKLERSRQAGKPLRIKFGMDPTAPDVTLGHAVPLSVIRQFQDWGHKAVLIIGDYTARVGDPSGRNTTRPVLSGEQIDQNATTYVNQIGKVLLTDKDHLEVRFNGEWFKQMSLIDILRLTSRKTVAQMLAREDFALRFRDGVDIRVHEFLYPLMQGHDSVMVQADVEMGGSDQLFNNLVGRELQQDAGQEPQVVIVTPLLVGTDGQIKMSKSKGNYIAVTDPPAGQDGMFGKIMSLPDSVMGMYYQLLTEEPMEQTLGLIQQKPRDAKVKLAKLMIAWMHGAPAADAAEAEFARVFRQGGVPDEMPEFVVGRGPHKIAHLLVKAELAASNGEAIRKIKEGAVSIDGQKVGDFQREYTFDQPVVLRLGRRFARLTTS